MASNTRDVIVVGGGIVGCLTAYLLARKGLTVTILEADSVGSHASGFAFGELGTMEGAGIPEPLLDFSLWCLQRHRSLSEELKEASGVDNQYRAIGRMKLAFEESEVSSYRKELEWQSTVTQLTSVWLETEEMLKVEPLANPECLGGVYVQGVAAVEPYRTTLAAAQAGQSFGVDMVQRRATGLMSDGDRCLGVTFQGGRLEAAEVVLAMGPWTQDASEWCRLEIPVRPLKGQILRLQHGGAAFKTSLYWGGSYVSSKPDGLSWAGTTEEEVGFNEDTTTNARDKIMHDLLKMAPSLSDAKLVQQTACLRPLSSDDLPIVGKVPGWDNLYVGTGAGRKGILWSTGMTQGLADLVLEGRTDVPGVKFLDPARFVRD